MLMYPRQVLFLFLFFAGCLQAQEGYSKKELLDMLRKPLADSTRIDAYNELTWPVYSYDIPDSSIYFGNKAIELAEKIKDIKRLSIAHRRIGITYINIGETKTSINHQQLSYELSEKINFKKGMQLALNNIGVAYLNNDLLNKALTYFLRSLKIVEETQNYSSVASLYYNCALIYRRTNDLKKSTEFLYKAKHYAAVQKNNELLIMANSNLSTNFRNMNQMDSARFYSNIAGKLLNAETSTTTKFNYYLNEGLFLSRMGENKKALEVFLTCKPYATVTSDEMTLLINIAEEYAKLNNKQKALEIFQQAYDLSLKTKTYNNLAYLSHTIAKIYKERKDFTRFSEMIEQHLNFKDSNDKYIRVQQIQQQQLEFDYERKQVADSLRFEHKERLKNIELEAAAAKLNKEKTFRIMLVVILVIIVLFSIFIFNRFMVTSKQNKIIERQKQIVELKNREIFDSINYAKRLQAAILPQLSDIKKELNLDILYLPKDIIGGDFYFFENYRGYTFFAICDCTGHGIPGALMSVVCHHALQKAIKEFNLSEPGAVLTKTRQIVIESLNATNQNIKDGMDCSLIVINNQTKEVKWAGANNHIWSLYNNELREIKADKQPVAFYENSKDFTTHTLNVLPGSFLYLFTDGYGDQFGGPKGKKYKNKSLKEFILSIQNEAVDTQVERMQKNILDWKGNLDQVDDIAIAAIKF